MTKNFDLNEYLNNGIENIVGQCLKISEGAVKQKIFLLSFAKTVLASKRTRSNYEEMNVHIPAFLIASIANECNLYCKGCYARENKIVEDKKEMLDKDEWGRLFREAASLGINFILLSGGEPMLRQDVLLAAGKCHDILFPVFTNGTLFDESTLDLFINRPNLIPIISIEGNEMMTDDRRGKSVYRKIQETFKLLKKAKLIFGVSITVTSINQNEVISTGFLNMLADHNCKIVIFVEYVDFDSKDDKNLSERERENFMAKLNEVRERNKKMMFVAFPGDELRSGGCLAAGRGFFHIDPNGDAEPCPFSPYSNYNLKNGTLLEAIQNDFFIKIQENGLLEGEHDGGCVLFKKHNEVEKLLDIDRR